MAHTRDTSLGRYEIVEEIGKGAMGVVYLAHDPLIGRTVALKTIRLDAADETHVVEPVKSEFLQEARSAGILSHPNIVTIHDVVAEDGSLPFIAMEYVKGSNLEEIIKARQALPLDFVVDTVSQIAQALDYAHAKGVIHRDIKPANILINKEEKVKITDFGIARFFSSDPSREEKVMGTPSYVSPEQIMRLPTDHRSDIYSFGVVAYEMITGRLPFEGKDVSDLAKRIAYEPHTPPTEYVESLPTLVANVLDKALHKHPEFRHQQAGELAEDLRAAVAATTLKNVSKHKRTEDLPRPAVPVESKTPSSGPDENSRAEATATGEPGPSAVRSLIQVVGQFFDRFKKDQAPPPIEPGVPATDEVTRDDLTTQDVALKMLEPDSGDRPAATPSPPRQRSTPTETFSTTRSASDNIQQPQAALLDWKKSKNPGIKRLLIVGVAAVLIFGSLAFLALRLASSKGSIDTSPSISHQRRLKYMELVQDGTAHLRAGNPVAAARSFELARQAAPSQLANGSKWLQQAQREIDDLQQYEALEQETLTLLRDGYEMIEQRDYQQAKDTASMILAINPQRLEALNLLEQAEEALASEVRESQARIARQTAPAASVETPENAQPEIADAEPEEPGIKALYTELFIDFFTQKSKGVLTIYAAEKQILREQFRYTRKAGFLRRRQEVSGGFEKVRRLETENIKLAIYLSSPDTDTQRANVDVDVSDGVPRLLKIRVDSEGVLTTQLLNARKRDS